MSLHMEIRYHHSWFKEIQSTTIFVKSLNEPLAIDKCNNLEYFT
jgi:hypothetical protein